jgi:ABC-type multidrug transport system ATPase subunit
MGKPDLVLLDEPTAGLDPANARKMRQQVVALAGDTTFVLSTLNLAELERMCGQVLHLEKGELKAQKIIGQQESKQSAAYLTLRLQANNTSIGNAIKQLKSVSQVNAKQNDELIIRYDHNENSTLDQQLLQLLAQQGIAYRQLTHGQSLEDQLFMNQK